VPRGEGFSTVQFYWDMAPGLSVNGYRSCGVTVLYAAQHVSSGLMEIGGRSLVGPVYQSNELKTSMSVNTVMANSNLASERQKLDATAAITGHENRNSCRNVVYSNYRPHAAHHPAYVQEHVWPRVTGTECPFMAAVPVSAMNISSHVDLFTNLLVQGLSSELIWVLFCFVTVHSFKNHLLAGQEEKRQQTG